MKNVTRTSFVSDAECDGDAFLLAPYIISNDPVRYLLIFPNKTIDPSSKKLGLTIEDIKDLHKFLGEFLEATSEVP